MWRNMSKVWRNMSKIWRNICKVWRNLSIYWISHPSCRLWDFKKSWASPHISSGTWKNSRVSPILAVGLEKIVSIILYRIWDLGQEALSEVRCESSYIVLMSWDLEKFRALHIGSSSSYNFRDMGKFRVTSLCRFWNLKEFRKKPTDTTWKTQKMILFLAWLRNRREIERWKRNEGKERVSFSKSF